jgi:pimeloyl-ACP methyl ester carboxylesterase
MGKALPVRHDPGKHWERLGTDMTKLFACMVFLLNAFLTFLPAAAKPVSPADAFYTIRPDDLNGAPGTLIRAQPIEIAFVYRAKAYRILYVTLNHKGQKVGASGMAVVSTFPRGAARPVVAWAHPTTGVARKCAPSLRSDPLAIPGVKDMIVQGYTVVATDYPGLGTAGKVPYLIGRGEAQAVLDSVKAIRSLPEAPAGNRFVLWGHSQGGHAALFAAGLARTYAGELSLLGVAVAAPATNLGVLLDADIHSVSGRILAAMTLLAWSRNYGFALDDIVNETTLKVIRHIDKNCVDGIGGELGALSAEEDLRKRFLTYDPDSWQPWRGLMADNNPSAVSIGVPVLVAQGLADPLVIPKVTATYVRSLCRTNRAVSYLTLPGVDHTLAAVKSAPQVVNWIEERFKGAHAGSTCGK